MPEQPTRLRGERVLIAALWSLSIATAVIGAWKLWTGELVINFDTQWVVGIGFIFVAFWTAYHFGRVQVGRRFLSPHGAFVCPRCHYSLRRLPDQGSCPECGTNYTRAQVVAMWERHFRLHGRYARVSGDGRPIDRRSTEPQPERAPWSSRSLSNAVDAVEAVARKHGFSARRFPHYAQPLAIAAGTNGRAFPSELEAFYLWFDPSLWSRFLGTPPAQDLAESTMTFETLTASGPPQAPVDTIRFREPSALRYVSLPPPVASAVTSVELGFGVSSTVSLSAPVSTIDAIEIADTHDGQTIYFVQAGQGLGAGAVIMLALEWPYRVWLADSLAQWLARLAACGGCDPVIDRARWSDVPTKLRLIFEREFREKNPGCPLLPISTMTS
jgi:hypothetical protein